MKKYTGDLQLQIYDQKKTSMSHTSGSLLLAAKNRRGPRPVPTLRLRVKSRRVVHGELQDATGRL